MSDKKERRGLGRGLSALMGDVSNEAPATSGAAPQPRKAEAFLPIEKVFANPHQPRRRFDEAALDDLSASIAAKGIIQPLIVRLRAGNDDTYEIVAGERRWRAAQRAQLHQVPVIIREFSDTEVLEIAIIENVQRADLNAFEEAAGYKQLMSAFGHTQEQLSKALGKSRSHIANMVRLLTLPEPVQEMIVDGRLSGGHARALVNEPRALAIAHHVIEHGLSVRETEKLIRDRAWPGRTSSAPSAKREKAFDKDADTRALEGDLSAALKMRVTIDHKPGDDAGLLTIRYTSFDQLDVLCQALAGLGDS